MVETSIGKFKMVIYSFTNNITYNKFTLNCAMLICIKKIQKNSYNLRIWIESKYESTFVALWSSLTFDS